MARVKTRELRGRPKEPLNKTLEEQKTELAKTRKFAVKAQSVIVTCYHLVLTV